MSETKFKQTGIGPIPEDWEVKRLGELLSVGSGRSYKHLSVGDVPVYGTGGLMCFVDDYLYDGETVCIGRKGTINVPYYHEGKIWTVDTLFFTHSFNGLIPKYAYYLFLTLDWLSKNEATGVPSLSRSNIEQTKVTVPPLAEQKRIAGALSSVDELIASLDRQIAKTRDIRQGVTQNLLKGKVDVRKTVGEVCEIKRGVVISEEYVRNHQGGYPVYSSQTENNGEFGRISTYMYDGEYVTWTTDGYAGSVFYRRGKFNITNVCGLLKVKDPTILTTKYLCYILQVTAKAYVNWDLSNPKLMSNVMATISIPIPPLAEQKHIASVLTSFDDTIEGLEAKRQKYESIKAGMMQQLLTGTIRLS